MPAKVELHHYIDSDFLGTIRPSPPPNTTPTLFCPQIYTVIRLRVIHKGEGGIPTI